MFSRVILRRVSVGAAALALAVTMGACSARPGVALSVDETSYTQDQVTQAAQEVGAVLGQPVQARDITTVLSLAETFTAVGEKYGVEVSDQEIRDLFAQRTEAIGGELSDTTVTVLRAAQISQSLNKEAGAEELGAALKAEQSTHTIELNPRYGQVDPNGFVSPHPLLAGVLDASQPPAPAPGS